MSIAAVIAQKTRRVNLTDVTSANEGGAGYSIKFHPNDNFIACGGNSTSKQLAIFSWNGVDTISEVETVDFSGTVAYSVVWHPNGNYLATARNSATGSITVYSWNGSDTLTSVATVDIDSYARWVDWNPSTNYLAVANTNTSLGVQVYAWNGSNSLTLAKTVNLSAACHEIRWSPDGTKVAVGSQASGKSLIIYGWNGSNDLTELASYNGNEPQSVVWSSDGAYLFAAESTATTTVRVYYFNGSSLTLKQTINLGLTGFDIAIFNDRYVAVVGYQGSVTSGSYVKLYKFSRATESLTEVDELTYTAYGALGVGFSKYGTFMGIGMYGETNKTIRIAKIYG